MLLPFLLFVALGWYDHSLVVDQARQQILSSASALNEQARNAVQISSLILGRVEDHVATMDWRTIDNSQEVHDFLARLKQDTPAIDSVFLVDPEGFNSASSRTYPMPRYDDRTREYYTSALHGDFGLVVSTPFVGQAAGSLGFTLSRARVTNGKFNGLIGVTLLPSYFEAFYRSVVQKPDASLAILVRADGQILARYPVGKGAPAQVPRDGPLLKAARSGATEGLFQTQSNVLGSEVMGGFMRAPDQPVFVAVVLGESAYLGEWYIHLGVLALFAALTSTALFLLSRRVLQRADRAQFSLERLIEETERRRTAEDALRQAQKMEAIGQLTGGIAHDFNNLLQGIIGSLDVMLNRIRQQRTGDLERLANSAMASANRAAALTHRLLAFARRQPLDPRPVQINQLIAAMEELLRRTMSVHIEIVFVLAKDLWLTACDQNQLESALLNLAINARDAMPDGGRLTIETANVALRAEEAMNERDATPGDYVCLIVTDTGIGMPPDVIEHAFDPFFTTKPTGQGTGLGLSMIYGFMRQSAGHARIRSEVGKGTEVQLCLPRYLGEEAQGEEAPELARSHPAEGEIVLVVEDETAVRELILEVLGDLGYRALEAADGPSGLAILQSDRRIDLLVTDIGLPGGLNGRQMADAARTKRPNLKVLFMTGYAENATTGEGFLAPGMALITKPFPLDTLANRIREMIELKRTPETLP